MLRLPFVQHSWLLLLFCSVPQANHPLRTGSPTQVTEFATAHDARVLHCFERLVGLTPGAETEQSHEIFRDSWVRQARLLFRFGGCGLRFGLRTAPAAHWASWADALLVRSRPSLKRLVGPWARHPLPSRSQDFLNLWARRSLPAAGLTRWAFEVGRHGTNSAEAPFLRLPSQTSSRGPTTSHTGGSFSQ